MYSQISQNPGLQEVFFQLFGDDGAEVYLKPVTDYITIEEPVNFYTVIAAASQKNESAIGYRQLSQRSMARENYGIVLNPVKSEAVKFSENDRIIVLAESY